MKSKPIRITLLLLTLGVLTGCGNMMLHVRQPSRLTSAPTSRGAVSLTVTDERFTTGRIGVLRGGFGNEVRDIFVVDDLPTTFTNLLSQSLEAAGFLVVPGTNAIVDARLTMFVTDSTGFGKFARHKVIVQLRDLQGEIAWEKLLLGEAAGMQSGTTASMEHCMNLALERLIDQAVAEFSSEFFRQQVRKINSGHP
jgi:hypothetical protein